jgi:alpha-L-rhamnosidase
MLVTCYAKLIFDLFAKMSALLGNTQQESYARKRANDIRTAFAKRFLETHPPVQTFYAALVYCDMVDDKQWAADQLAQCVKETGGHIHAGIFGAHMVPLVLRDYGYFDLAWEMVCKEEYPGWIYLMNLCQGTMGERWRGLLSLNHHMFTSVDGFIQGALSGLRIEEAEPGFQTVHLKPFFPKGIGHFSFYHQLDAGRIEINWDEKTYRVVIPEGVEGTVTLSGQTHSLCTGENIFSR